MKYGSKDVSDLTDFELTAAHHNCGQAQKLRDKASQHDKFHSDGWGNNTKNKKMEFPPINPKFNEMKTEIENEMRKRKLIP